jgi:hypothetical protein
MEQPAEPVAQAPAADEPAREHHRARSIIATVLGILTVVVLVVSVVAVWARATVLRRDRFTSIVASALDEPDVQVALAQKITDEVFTAIDVQTALANVLPDQLDRFAPTIASGAQTAVQRSMENVLARDDVQRLLVTLVGRAHDRLIQLLKGDGLVDGIKVVDGAVTVNLLPLINRGLTFVQNLGLLDNVQLPQLTADGDPAQQNAQLSQALGRDLPEDFGQLVVYQSESLANAQSQVQAAQDMFILAMRAVVLLVIVWLVLAAATILVAPRRWRAALLLGIGTAAAVVILRAVVRRVVIAAPGLVDPPGAKAATDAIVGTASESLLRLAGVMLLVGLVVVAAAMIRRRRWREDLILVGAVAVGAAIVAAVGFSIWSLLVGIAVGIAVPFVARWLLPAPRTRGDGEPPVAPSAPVGDTPAPATA